MHCHLCVLVVCYRGKSYPITKLILFNQTRVELTIQSQNQHQNSKVSFRRYYFYEGNLEYILQGIEHETNEDSPLLPNAL